MGNQQPKEQVQEKPPPESSKGGDEDAKKAEQKGEAEKNLVPTKFTWRYGGNEVLLTGSFSNWRESVMLRKDGEEMTAVLRLAPGSYEYKFIVDNQWRYDGNQAVVKGCNGNINNVIHVQAPQAKDTADPEAPQVQEVTQYGTAIETGDDLAKDPPLLPPQLQISLMNAPMDAIDPGVMPVPQHVVLNHLHCSTRDGILAMASAHRYQKKYVTTVMFKPAP